MASGQPQEIDIRNEQSLNTLVRAITLAQNQFALILVRCNYAQLRDRTSSRLQERCPFPIHTLMLPESAKTLYTTIQTEIKGWSDEEVNYWSDQESPSMSSSPLSPPHPLPTPPPPPHPIPPHPQALMIFGLEAVTTLDQVLIATNIVREELRKQFQFPLVLWVNDDVLRELKRLASDLYSWAGNTLIQFEMDIPELVQSLRIHANRLFSSILDMGDEQFPAQWAIASNTNSLRQSELKFALDDIYASNYPVEPDLRACLDFLLGQDAHTKGEMEIAHQHYERSLRFWLSQVKNVRDRETCNTHSASPQPIQTSEPENEVDKKDNEAISSSSSSSPPHPPPPSPSSFYPIPYLERAACVLFYLGLWWRTYAILQRTAYERAYQQAYHHFQQSLELFTQENRQDLVARFIIAQAETLQKLGQMDQLETLAKQALVLHKLYRDLVRQARDHGFLAETALSRSDWIAAKQRVNIALQILELAEEALYEADPPNPHLESSLELAQRYHYGWYLFLLARAEKELGNLEAAIHHLEIARDHNHPQNDPPLYIRILRTLRDYYFEKGEYQLAFRTKQLRRLIEHQFGYRAFVGALRLQPQPHQADLPFIPAQLDQQELMAQEIEASGRQQDVKRLVDRLSLPKDKLVVIHGPSGVGKSSILTAGLVPMLQDRLLGERTAFPILLEVYTDWQGALEKKLETALGNQSTANGQQLFDDEGAGNREQGLEEDMGTRGRSDAGNSQSPISNLQFPSPDTQHLQSLVLRSLHRAINSNLLPVLIFDQFEEFFFVYDTVQARRPFYDFLRDCLNLPFVKVILALREDYLHYLLEFQRLTDLDIINNDILSKDIRYPLGDLSPDDTRVVIKSLTDKAQYYLPDDLIDELVDDLAGDLGEVRPIELQVVGAEIQAEGIATLAEYRQKGPKEKLVQRSLETVVKDCGPENEDLARIILFLLTNENGTRPLKTQDDLEADLVDLGMTHEINKLDLVLEVLVGSGLVFLIPELPSDLYQLVHDYLVDFIRQEQESDIGRLAAELEKERAQRRLSEARLEQAEQEKQTLAEANRRARQRIWVGSAFLGVSVLTAMVIGISAVQVHRNAESQLKLAQDGTRLEQAGANVLRQFQLEPSEKVTALISAVQIGQRLKSLTAQDLPLEQYPATSPLMTLQVILDTLQAQEEENGNQIQTGKTAFSTNQKIITSLVFSPDGQQLATAGQDGTVQISNLVGQPLKRLETEQGAITSLNFSPDGQRLATTGQDGVIQIWSQSGQPIAKFKPPDAIVTGLSFSADGNLLVTVNGSGKVELWDWSWQEPERPQKLREIKNDLASRIRSVSVSRDRQRFVTIELNGTVRFWSVLGRLLDQFDSYQSQPRQVSLSPDGEHIATVGFDGTVRLWNLVGRQVAQFGGRQSKITTVSFSPDGKQLAIAQNNGSIQLQPIRNLDELLTQGCTWLKDYFRTYPEAEEACQSKSVAEKQNDLEQSFKHPALFLSQE